MKAFGQFIKKEIFHIFRDPRTLLILFGLPVIQVILFGFAVRTEINDADIAILDKSKDYITKELTNKILSSGYFNITANIMSDKDIEAVFKSGKAKQVIVFEPEFAHKLYKEGKASIQLLNDASNPNVANMLNAYASSIINNYSREINKKGNNNIRINPEIKMRYNPELKSVFMFVPGLISFILLLVSALMTSIAISKEKEMGTMEILLVSPLKPQMIIVGKVIPYIFLAIVNAVSVLIIALTIFELPFRGSFVLFFAETILFIMTSLALGILISTISKTQQAAMMISLAGLMMPAILLSGFIFPIDNMPVFLQWVSCIIPARWFLVIEKAIMIKGLGIEYIWKETLILAGMTIFYIAMSIKKFKIRLE